MSNKATANAPAHEPKDYIHLKRQVTVKSLVNDNFRSKAAQELSDELKVIDTQISQLETQYQLSIQQLEKMAQQGQNINKNLESLNREAQEKRNQLSTLKLQVSTQMGNLEKIENGAYIVTGMLDNFVEVRIGDNIYDKIRHAEILLEDGVVREIRG